MSRFLTFIVVLIAIAALGAAALFTMSTHSMLAFDPQPQAMGAIDPVGLSLPQQSA